ncbi:MAG: cob(I)yrinic acid a,c-diamide adenosyltransferase [Deltaproteobacteria bacterium]|nr:cob(I)yrinic acid a,c-diamide adenosyltransferase [Deltaproteobacteria bacterium]
MRRRLEQGHIQVYTGEGKGKTTCAFGLALRAVGQGLQVYLIQFLKGQDTGELKAAQRLAPELTVQGFGRPVLVNLRNPTPEDLALARDGLDLARRVIAGGDYDLVVLDEINVALAYNLIPLKEVLDMLKRRPAGVEVVLTGRAAPPELIDAADLVTEMVPRKHYWDKGTKARQGIEW